MNDVRECYRSPVYRKLVLSLALVTAVLVTYLPALRAGFVWNDDTYITDNPTLDGAWGLKQVWTNPRANEQYYPLVFTTFWVEKLLFGLDPTPYHVVNVLLHAAAALLLWRLLRRLELPGGWFAAALFALHPVCVESVAWIAERKNTLSLVLTLLAALTYLRWLEARAAAAEGSSRKKKHVTPRWYLRPGVLYLGVLLLLALALFAKTTASLLAPVLLVLVWWRKGRLRAEDVWPTVPLFLVGAALAWHTAWLEKTMVRASGADWSLGLLGRLVLAGRATVFYLGKLLWPADLMFIYPRFVVDPTQLWQWLPVLAVAGVVISLLLLRRRLGRGPLAGALLLVGVLFPALGFFNVYAMRFSWVADHFAYQAVAVGAAVLAAGAAGLAAGKPPLVRNVATGCGVAVLLVLATLSYRHARAFHDEDTLWRTTLAANPSCFMCHVNYGHLLYGKGRVAEAVEHFEASLRLKPDNVPALLNLARADEEALRYADAARRLEAALAFEPTNSAVLVNLGTVYTKDGRYGEAVGAFEEALRNSSPDDYLAHNGLGVALVRQGQVLEAARHFREAVRLRPDYAPARANLERALALLAGQR